MTKARIQEFVIADPGSESGAGPIRNPGCAWHWMPDRVRHDKPILALREHLRHRHWMPDRSLPRARSGVRHPCVLGTWIAGRARNDIKGALLCSVVVLAHIFPGNRPASWATLAA